MELICNHPYLLQWLGAAAPRHNDEYKAMRDRGDIVVRFTSADTPTMFWPVVPDPHITAFLRTKK